MVDAATETETAVYDVTTQTEPNTAEFSVGTQTRPVMYGGAWMFTGDPSDLPPRAATVRGKVASQGGVRTY